MKAVHLKLKEYKCDYCGVLFAQSGQLKIHMVRRHSLTQITFLRPHEFLLLFQARKHLDEKNFLCSECDFRGVNRSVVNRHIRVKHQKIRDFLCNQCGYGSATRKQLDLHIEKMHRNKKRRKLKPIIMPSGFRLKDPPHPL